MQYPPFYEKIPSILLYDPLSEFLGAFEKGKMEISYLDCVKLAGHSCPTVAGAYLMAKLGLERLYKETLPQRGSVKVEMKASKGEGVTGVTCNIISFIVGASDNSGFKGIQGNFSRHDLLSYDVPMDAEVKLTRLDTMQSVTLSYDPSSVPPDAQMMPLMKKNLQGTPSKEESTLFQTLWQKRVEEILLSTDKHHTFITIQE
ncbi:FmdE family protein [Sulfurovum sp.]|uniref:FmdE family protein n=1 Tax=Sulfurovum sp. TaxID=1969726 RepID=UPI0028680FCE|nr:FmdE family protein [Sulfurovum sp.]